MNPKTLETRGNLRKSLKRSCEKTRIDVASILSRK